jgi:CubicO group peptidase (beta-lactamase class C family)
VRSKPSPERSKSLSAPEALVRELHGELARLQRESPAPSVAGALFRGEDLLWSEAIGLADVERGREATPDTQYAIASITKTFVAAAIMLLREEGRLSLDDPLGRHVEEAEREGVTIRRLLAHASGIQREVPGNAWETLEMPDREQLLGTLAEAEQVLDPGAQWHYSNLAYALVGEVIQRISGVPVERFVQERLLEPLGLERTTWGPGENAATGYFVDRFADVAHPEPVVDKRALAAAGALWSTVGDLARWGAYLMEREEMHAVQVMADPERWLLAWGLGLILYRRGERLFAGHDGGTVGHCSHLSYSRKEKVGVAVLTNTSNPSLS